MACIRTVKPEFWTDETIVELSMAARLLFIGIWNFTDHQGRMEFSVKRIKMLVFPAETSLQIPPLLAELQGENLIEVYGVENKLYLQVNNFAKHQKIDVRYAKSKNPPPDSSVSRRIPLVEWSGVEWSGVDNSTVRQAELVVNNSEQKPAISKLAFGDNDCDTGELVLKSGGVEHLAVVEPEKRVVKDAPQKPDHDKPETDQQAPRVVRHESITILEFLNSKAGRNYRPVPANLDMIKARLKEYSAQELKQVIALKVREWGQDDNMEKFLRPKTLFNRTNCANYIGELVPAEDSGRE